MVVATRVMYLMSGVLILVSGVYIQIGFISLLSDLTRFATLVVAAIYFVWQFRRFLRLEYTKQVDPSFSRQCRKFGLDFNRQ